MNIFVENIDSIIIIIYCILIGIVIAFIASLLTKGIYGRFIEAMLSNSCDCEVNAKTLDELGIKKSILLINALQRRTTLSSLVSCDDEKLKAEYRRYYILPEHQIKAQGIFGTERLTPLTLAVTVILFAIIIILLQFVVPKIL
ncbi:MAG: hypothetical protein IKL05_05575 [Clostridia bacterium]|nr:hypothetical protein [Clostridia bacterium]